METEERKSKAKDSTIERAIINLLHDYPIPLTRSMIRAHIASYGPRWTIVLDKLVSRQIVRHNRTVREAVDGSHRTVDHYSLADQG